MALQPIDILHVGQALQKRNNISSKSFDFMLASAYSAPTNTGPPMHTIDNLICKALWIFGPSAFAILIAFAANSALKSDGFYFSLVP